MAAKINWHRYGTELRHCHLMYNPAGGVPWNNNFYLLDAVLALVLAMALCPSVRRSVSVKSRSSIETAERIELVFGVGASFHLSYTLLTGNSSVSKNKGTIPSGTLSRTPDSENFAMAYGSLNVLST